jgi:hypothetical protein
MMIAKSYKRCSYYLVFMMALGLHEVASSSETKIGPSEAKVTESASPKTVPPKPLPSVKAEKSKPVKTHQPAASAAAESAKKTEAAVETPKGAVAASLPAALPEAVPPAVLAVPPPGVSEPGEGCPTTAIPAPEWDRSETYKGMPFQSGEESRYILKYGLLKVHVGYGFLRVLPPAKYSTSVSRKEALVVSEGRWHRVFSAEAYTGDWYKMIFAGHDKMQAYARPWDFGVTKFYISQNEEKPFVRRFHAEKWLDFDHVACNVHERTLDHKKKKESLADHFLQPAALDALSALFKLRTYTWQLNKTERILVYTSEKNWWLEATPIAEENVTTVAGDFRAHKLEVKTYLGKELQQRGKLFVWIAADHPQRPMIRVEGVVTFGSVYLELDRFTAGAS